MLGVCIQDYVDDPRLKMSASRAVWLGNNQTHYQQKYTDRDLESLKKLIRASVHWVSMILETKDAESIPHPSNL